MLTKAHQQFSLILCLLLILQAFICIQKTVKSNSMLYVKTKIARISLKHLVLHLHMISFHMSPNLQHQKSLSL